MVQEIIARCHGLSYLNEIDLIEAVVAAGFLDIKDGYDVLVVEVPQQLHLSKSSQTEHGMIEGCNLLDRDLLARRFMDGRAVVRVFVSPGPRFIFGRAPHWKISPDNSISSLSDNILNVILLADIERDLSGTAAPFLDVAHGWNRGVLSRGGVRGNRNPG